MIKKICLMTIMCVTLSGCLTKNSGEKVGIITKVSHEGMIPFCKTHEVEIVRGGLSNGSGTLGGAFHFTVNDADLLVKVVDAMEKQQEVKIYYHEEAFLLWTHCESHSDSVFLDKIEVLTK